MASKQTFTTTLAEPVGINDTAITVASGAGFTNPGSESALNGTPTFVQIDQEWMQVDASYQSGSDIIPVIRGIAWGPFDSTNAEPHAAGATVTVTTEDNYQFS